MRGESLSVHPRTKWETVLRSNVSGSLEFRLTTRTFGPVGKKLRDAGAEDDGWRQRAQLGGSSTLLGGPRRTHPRKPCRAHLSSAQRNAPRASTRSGRGIV